jgi:hypothetical protein
VRYSHNENCTTTIRVHSNDLRLAANKCTIVSFFISVQKLRVESRKCHLDRKPLDRKGIWKRLCKVRLGF